MGHEDELNALSAFAELTVWWEENTGTGTTGCAL